MVEHTANPGVTMRHRPKRRRLLRDDAPVPERPSRSEVAIDHERENRERAERYALRIDTWEKRWGKERHADK
jgi:hypothetical protein